MVKLFSHYVPSNTLFQLVLDILLLFASVLLAFFLQSGEAVPSFKAIVPSALFFAFAMMVLNTALGLYRPSTAPSITRAATRVSLSLLLTVPVAYVVFHALPWAQIGAGTVELSVLLALVVVIVFRGFVSPVSSAPIIVRRLLVVGTGQEALQLQRLAGSAWGPGLEIAGFYPLPGEDAAHVPAERILPLDATVAETARELRADEVVVAVRERRGGSVPLDDLLTCKLAGMPVRDLSSFYERVLGQVRVDSLRASWLIYGEGFRQGVLRAIVKRIFDLSVTAVLLVLSAPVMLATALLIRLESSGPVLYRQQRVGQGGRSFNVIKFRSMRVDAEKDGQPRWASQGDDRVTRVGRVIRRLRIDELPQLFNVLKGDMSLVGPRPERPYFVDQLARQVPFYGARHSVKPGVTGWAQVRYHYGASVDDAVEKLQYDLYYVKNHTLFLDLLVLLETVRVVLTGQGAH
jgi:sugar transferase (PEP-CTERM system associated)